MDFIQFSKSQRYESRVPLRQLHFEITVWKALLVEEDKKEVLAHAVIPWDGKIYSPAESLEMLQDLQRLAKRQPRVEGNDATPPLHFSDLSTAAALGLGSAAPPSSSSSPSAIPLLMKDLPSSREVLEQLQNSQSCLFTRPPKEDYINIAEEDVPVDPSQGPSRLAPIILCQHRKDHQQNCNMYIMWASGSLLLNGAGLPPPPAQSSSAHPSSAAAGHQQLHHGATAAADDRHRTRGANSTAEVDLDRVEWSGRERVVCCITAEAQETAFRAKPNLMDFHTLMVDSSHIYTFRVVARRAAPTAAPMMPLDAVVSNLRDLSAVVLEQCMELDVTEGAAARRLLRQAVLLVPSDRAGAGGGGGGHHGYSMAATASTAAGGGGGDGASPSPRGGRHRSPSLPPSGAEQMGASFSTFAVGRRRGRHPSLLTSASLSPAPARLPSWMSCRYMFGVVERCRGISESSVFLRCQILECGAAMGPLHGEAAASTASPHPPYALDIVSQLSHASAMIDRDFLMEVVHVLDLPFEYHDTAETVGCAPLRLLLSAFTEGAWADGLQSAVGYGCVSLPVATPGRHTLTVALWAPRPTGRELVQSLLLGGAPSLVDARQAAPPPMRGTGINVKGGMATDAAGYVDISVQVLHQRQPTLQ